MINFYAKEKEVRKAFETNRPMILFVYKEANFSHTDIVVSVPLEIQSVLMQEKRPIAYFSEKLSGAAFYMV